MSKISNICFVLTSFPNEGSYANIFAKELITQIADQNFDCTIIAPQNLLTILCGKRKKYPYKRIMITQNGNKIEVYAPLFFLFHPVVPFAKYSIQSGAKAIIRTIKRNQIKCDVLYSHFIFPFALSLFYVKKAKDIKTFVAVGESTRFFYDKNSYYEKIKKKLNWKEMMENLDGIISVSETNKTALIEKNYIGKDYTNKILVSPNSVDLKLFQASNKKEMRKKFGFPEDAFIVVYCGTFDDRKGVERLDKALSCIDNVYSIFIGCGKLNPTNKNILFKGKVEHDLIPQYYSSADVFVLPTKSEGCCNAIVEAIACGLPIISSNGSFNDILLDPSYSIRIDPNNVNDIISAIIKLRDNKDLCNTMASNAMAYRNNFDNVQRAKNIINFISDRV